jgi:hypothetical protein
VKKCPYCGKKYSDNVERCAVDQTDLVACSTSDTLTTATQATATTSTSSVPRPASSAKLLGWILLWAGIAGTLYFAFVFTTVLPGSDVVNLDRQQDRLLGFIESQVNFLAGLLVVLLAKPKSSDL